MNKTLLSIANNLFSLHDTMSVLVFLGVALSTFGVLTGVIGVAGVVGSPAVLALLVAASLALAGSLLLVRLVRWNLVSVGIRGDLDWIISHNPSLIIGVGPGGAIIAGMIAKQLAIRVKREPPVFVIDRVFRKAGRALSVQVSKTGQINVDLIGQAGRVLLVTSEVHSGNTMRLVSQELDEAGVTHDTFSFLVSPHSSFAVDRHILRSDHRGILPWPDAPAREEP